MNIPEASDGKIVWGEPVSSAGDYVVLCAQDILPVNSGKPVEAHYQILS